MLDWVTFYTSGFKKEEDQEIALIGNFVETFFLLCLQGFNIKGLGKVSIQLSKNLDNVSTIGLFPGNPVVLIRKPFDISNFLQSNRERKRLILLDELLDAFEFLSQKYKWDITEIRQTYKIVKSLNFKYNFLLEPIITSRNKKYKACVEVVLENEEAVVSILFIDAKTGNTLKRLRVETVVSPFIFNYRGLLGKRKWLDDDKFELFIRSGSWKYIGLLSTGKVQKVELGRDMKKVLNAAYSSKKIKILNPPTI